MAPDTVVIMGAGIIGLQSALAILDLHSQGNRPLDLAVVAKGLPGDPGGEDYASPWAGAHWRPHSSPTLDARQCRWDVRTYDSWVSRYASDPPAARRAGVKLVPETIISDLGPLDEQATWFAPHVQSYTHLSPSALPAGAATGARFMTFAINVPKYLLHLRSALEARGVKFVRATLPLSHGISHACEAATTAAGVRHSPGRGKGTVVNALGIAAGELCNDDAVYPIRGQTLLLNGEAHECVTRQTKEGLSYLIPRPGSGTTILGGVNEANVWRVSEEEGQNVTEGILARAEGLGAPYENLKGADGRAQVLRVNSGVRPARKGGARVEREMISDGERKWTVVHAYGVGGAGYQNSVGLGDEVARLVLGVEKMARL